MILYILSVIVGLIIFIFYSYIVAKSVTFGVLRAQKEFEDYEKNKQYKE